MGLEFPSVVGAVQGSELEQSGRSGCGELESADGAAGVEVECVEDRRVRVAGWCSDRGVRADPDRLKLVPPPLLTMRSSIGVGVRRRR